MSVDTTDEPETRPPTSPGDGIAEPGAEETAAREQPIDDTEDSGGGAGGGDQVPGSAEDLATNEKEIHGEPDRSDPPAGPPLADRAVDAGSVPVAGTMATPAEVDAAEVDDTDTDTDAEVEPARPEAQPVPQVAEDRPAPAAEPQAATGETTTPEPSPAADARSDDGEAPTSPSDPSVDEPDGGTHRDERDLTRSPAHPEPAIEATSTVPADENSADENSADENSGSTDREPDQVPPDASPRTDEGPAPDAEPEPAPSSDVDAGRGMGSRLADVADFVADMLTADQGSPIVDWVDRAVFRNADAIQRHEMRAANQGPGDTGAEDGALASGHRPDTVSGVDLAGPPEMSSVSDPDERVGAGSGDRSFRVPVEGPALLQPGDDPLRSRSDAATDAASDRALDTAPDVETPGRRAASGAEQSRDGTPHDETGVAKPQRRSGVDWEETLAHSVAVFQESEPNLVLAEVARSAGEIATGAMDPDLRVSTETRSAATALVDLAAAVTGHESLQELGRLLAAEPAVARAASGLVDALTGAVVGVAESPVGDLLGPAALAAAFIVNNRLLCGMFVMAKLEGFREYFEHAGYRGKHRE